ncbi:hypothetical protein F2P81_026096 [Scophthalmus maximus]|uniref:Striatin N-terminal domain-containing protein n=1 Tax=Scophthalmus maximus TaxID=52904 RepID=A0A6A4RQX3_SCOMX|nr:hypothetical protein F2P81_026096 [Scophthalmus maximus]
MMDEQAGPGVFFSGNNSSSLPGGVRAPQPGDGEAAAARAQFSVPGILHFLQHEWARFEVERAQSEVERAELQNQYRRRSDGRDSLDVKRSALRFGVGVPE